MGPKSLFRLLGIYLVGAGFNVSADTVVYKLENLILTDDTQMTGSFTWTFDPGAFENGVGQFTSLVIPHTAHDHTDLNVSFDIKKSIEISLPGSFHDDGVDIMLLLEIPLTPTIAAPIKGPESSYDIGGNSFYVGQFKSGVITPENFVDDVLFRNGFEQQAP